MQDAVSATLARETSRQNGVVIAAVSGGIDSSVMLDVLAEQALMSAHPLEVAHVHHGVRGADADRDAAFVEQRATALGLRFHLLDVNAANVWRNGRVSEGRLRDERYRVLTALARQRGASCVFTAHHRDDRVESVVLAQLRGAGLRGLAGMPRRRPLDAAARAGARLVRPLFDVGRNALHAYADAHAIAWRDDASNADTRFSRNAIRHEFLPQLRVEFGAGIDARLLRLARLARVLAKRVRGMRGPTSSDGIHARLEAAAGTTLRKATSLLAQRIIESGGRGSVDVATGVRLAIDRGRAERVLPPAAPPATATVTLRTLTARAARIAAGQNAATFARRLRDRGFIYVDADAVGGAPQMRTRRAGDRIEWPGVAAPVRLKSLFSSHHVPRELRPHLVVIEAVGRIVAVEGFGPAADVRVGKASRRVQRVAIRRSDEAPHAPPEKAARSRLR